MLSGWKLASRMHNDPNGDLFMWFIPVAVLVAGLAYLKLWLNCPLCKQGRLQRINDQLRYCPNCKSRVDKQGNLA
jgi:hypothetical protein